MSTLGAVVFTLRGMQHIDRCVESVKWADRIDLHALDDEERVGRARQQVATDWVLYLWGEEQVDPELSEAIQVNLGSTRSLSVSRYFVRVRSRLLERWLEASCWGPTPSPRLLRRSQDQALCCWSPGNFDFRADSILPGWISDHSFEELSNGVDHLNALSSIWARGEAHVPHSSMDLIGLPVRVFGRLFFRNKLCLRGLPGLGLSVIASYTCMAAAMKSWEMRSERCGKPPPETPDTGDRRCLP